MSFLAEVSILEAQATWELSREPSIGFELYALFLFIVCVVGAIKLIRVWRIARLLEIQQRNNSIAADRLQAAARSLGRWMGLTTLVCGILASASLSSICEGLLMEKVIGSSEIVSIVRDFATGISMALFVILFLYLIRWYFLFRIDHLQKRTNPL